MKAVHTSIINLLQGSNKQYIIPIFQRPYDWSKEQCLKLLTDILNIMTTEKKTHFIGSIVYLTDNEFQATKAKELSLIDGQQRITTVSLLLLALSKYIKKQTDLDEDEITEKQIMVQNIINEFSTEDYKFKLRLNEEDFKVYKEIVEDLEIDNKENNVYKNYKYIYDFLDKNDFKKFKNLYEAISKLTVVDISLDRESDDPQLIFESLNSTGLDLKQSDLIRNFLLMTLKREEQIKIYKEYWLKMEDILKTEINDFFVRFLTMKMKKGISEKNLFEEFKEFFNNKIENGETNENIMSEALDFTRIYDKMKSSVLSKELNETMRNLNELESKVFYPIIMHLVQMLQEERINANEILLILKSFESLIVRRMICDLPTASLRVIAIDSLKFVNDSDICNSVFENLLKYEGKHRFPKNAEFESNFRVKDIYNLNGKNKFFILKRLENGSSKEKISTDNLTVEHIMPQTLTKEWKEDLGINWEKTYNKYLHTIGNLTLSGYNSNLSNKTFVEKRDSDNGYKNSPLRLNKNLKYLSKWNEEEILERQKELVELGLKTWRTPEIKK